MTFSPARRPERLAIRHPRLTVVAADLAPVILTDGVASGSYRMSEHLAVKGMARIPRADVADAMLRCLDDTTTHGKRYVLAP